MDTLIANRSCDIQWGNHDVVWTGAMMGQEACIAIAVANSLKYKNTLFLEECLLKTPMSEKLLADIEDLKNFMFLYNAGVISEKSN